MAYFAELDSSNTVIRTISVADADCLDENGIESEQVGVSFCERLFGGRWIQTSFTGRIRNMFASPGLLYFENKDVFVYPQPHPWYVLNESLMWESPLGIHPDTGLPLEDWQWDYLEVAFAVKPDYSSLFVRTEG